MAMAMTYLQVEQSFLKSGHGVSLLWRVLFYFYSIFSLPFERKKERKKERKRRGVGVKNEGVFLDGAGGVLCWYRW